MDILLNTKFDYTAVCENGIRVLIKMTGDEDFFYIIQSNEYVDDEKEFELISKIKKDMKVRSVLAIRS